MDDRHINVSNSSDETMFDFTRDISWALWIKEVLTPIIVTAGIVGNILSFVVMSSRTLRHKSYSFYLRALAIFDSLVLIDRQLLTADEFIILHGHQSVFHNFGDVACKALRFSENVCCLMSSWLVVFMAVERFVAIYFPLRKTVFCTKRRALAAMFCLFSVVCCSQMHVLVMMEHAHGGCSAKAEYRLVYLRMYTYMYLLVLILVLPVSLIGVCNSMVMHKIIRYRQIACDNGEEKADEHSTWITQRRHKTTFMLVTITTAYIVTLMPVALISVIIQILVQSKPRLEAFEIVFGFEPFGHLLEVWSVLNYGINFFIYILSGKRFRQELMQVFRGSSTVRTNAVKTKSTDIREEIPLTHLENKSKV